MMNSSYQFDTKTGRPQDDRIVYVRPMDTKELPDHIREQAGNLKKVYGVFGANGEQIALTANRSMAFDLARDNELTPLSVH